MSFRDGCKTPKDQLFLGNGRSKGRPTEDMRSIRETHVFQRTRSERYSSTQDDRQGIRTSAAKNVQMPVLWGMAPYQQGEMIEGPLDSRSIANRVEQAPD
jgi:hypothetical protein